MQLSPSSCCIQAKPFVARYHAQLIAQPSVQHSVRCLAAGCEEDATAAVTPQATRRVLLIAGTTAASSFSSCLQQRNAAEAAVTVTLRPRGQLKQYELRAGFSVTVPDTWSLAYDRSADPLQGTQAFFGNFRTFETLAILKVPKPEGDLSPQQLLELVLAEQTNNQSTYDFKLLSGDVPARREVAEDGSVFYDSEYLQAICRGVIQEGAGGTKRCIGPRDMDLEVVSRTFFQAFTVVGDAIYVVRGSATSDKWDDIRAAAVEATQSFRLPAQTANAATA